MKTGIVYESREQVITEVKVGDILGIAKPVGIWMKRLGFGIMLMSILGVYWIYGPLVKAEMQYRNIDTKTQRDNDPVYKETRVLKIQSPKDSEMQRPSEYRIFIPKIEAEAPVIPNINPFDKNAYSEALLKGVVEASGLSHPGQLGTTFLFAHSVGNRLDFARYNAVFYLLDKLENGDKIYVFYNGQDYQYEVDKKQILRANDLQYLQPQNNEEKLVLQTCYPPGTSWKRLVVVGKRVNL